MPQASVILATYNRPRFLTQVFKYYAAQTFTDTELIILDDSEVGFDKDRINNAQVRYCHVAQANLGAKLNAGIVMAESNIILKWDDDDFYGPRFIELALKRLGWIRNAIVSWTDFLVLLHGTLHWAHSAWRAGGTLCFYRDLWECARFRDVPAQVDGFFFQDHALAMQLSTASIHPPAQVQEQYILVRHGQNTWQDYPGEDSADAMIAKLPTYAKPIADVVGPDNADFYRGLEEPAKVDAEVVTE